MSFQQKRRRKDTSSQCNGTGSPKRHRESVLRLTGEDRRDGGLAPSQTCLDDSEGDGDLESLDRSIVQFTVGAEDPAEVIFPIIFPNLEARNSVGTPRRSLSSNQDNTATAEPSEYTNTDLTLLLKVLFEIIYEETVSQAA